MTCLQGPPASQPDGGSSSSPSWDVVHQLYSAPKEQAPGIFVLQFYSDPTSVRLSMPALRERTGG